MADEHSVVHRIAGLRDPVDRLRAVTAQLVVSQREVNQLARLRRETIQGLHDSGMSYAQIADAVGVSRGRIHQIKHAGPPPEAAFLGTDVVTILTPLKQDKIGDRPVVAVEDVAGAQQLADLARGLGLEVVFEHIPVGGAVNLNREGLVVICGPRLSKPVANVLAQDPVLRFARPKGGPYMLVDARAGKTHKSGSDETPASPSDVAYLGRLSRPDGAGTVLVFTGIHPPGSLGVVEFLRTQLGDLYADVGTERFSTLIGTDYDPSTNLPANVKRLTPLYRMEAAR